MTPLEFAENLAKSDQLRDQALGVGIVIRGLTDDDPSDPLRQGWPMNEGTAQAAARYLFLEPAPELIAEALRMAPDISDAMLNRGASTQ